MSRARVHSERCRHLTRTLACFILGSFFGIWGCITRADTTLAADIAPQPVADALAEFAHQTRLQVIYVSKIVKARTSKGARAGLKPAEALPSLLDGTGLTFEFLNSRTVRILEPAAAVTAAQPTAADAPKAAAKRSALWFIKPEEIIVSGSRDAGGLGSAEAVQSVAASVSVVSGGTLEAQKLNQLSDYAAYLPALNLDVGGVPSLNTVQLRGIGFPYSGNGQTVGFSIDDAPVAIVAATPELVPYDLERLEVLRGPQGTLGGAGSLSGLIRYVLNEPSLRGFNARVGVDVSTTNHASRSGGSVQAMVNAPIVEDVLAVRLSAYDAYRPGFIDNAYSGTEDVNALRRYGGRITTLWRPAESFSVKVTALWNRIDADSRDGVASTGVATARDGDANIYDVSNSWKELKQFDVFLPTYQANLDLYSATVHWDPGSLKIFSATTWSRSVRNTVVDSSSGADFPANSDGAIPPGLSNFQQESELESFSEELRIASSVGSRTEWLLGGFYTDNRLIDRQGEYAFDTSYRPIAYFAPALWFQEVPSTFEKWSLFGDLTWRITDQLDVTGGLRYDHDDQAFSAIVAGSTIPEPYAISGRYSEGVTTWAMSGRYHFMPEVMLYARLATGYQPGSTNGPGFLPVQADSLTSYELGLKSEFLDRRGMIDFTVFYIDWQDIQLSAHDWVRGFFLINGGTAESQGVELATSWSPFATLRLGYNAAYTKAEFTQLVPAGQYYMTRYQMPQVPRWSMAFTADDDWALTDAWHAHAGVALRWIGPLWALDVESRSHDGGPSFELPAYSILDLNASVAKGPLALRVFVRNLADTRASLHNYYLDVDGTIAQTAGFMVQPRTIGIGFDYAVQ